MQQTNNLAIIKKIPISLKNAHGKKQKITPSFFGLKNTSCSAYLNI